jgi:hypothetical protein
LSDILTCSFQTKAAKLKQSRRLFLGFENEDGGEGSGEGKQEEEDEQGGSVSGVAASDAPPLRRRKSMVVMAKQNADAKTLVGDDFELAKPLGDQKLKDDIVEELKGLIGMSTAKEWFQLLERKVMYVQMTGDVQVLQTCLSVIITGNPGTGKTRFAEILCRFLVVGAPLLTALIRTLIWSHIHK